MTAPALDPAVLDTLRSLNRPGEPDLVEQVLTMFLEDSPARIEAMSTAIGARDAVQLQRAAHNLKGSAANVGATELQRLSADLAGSRMIDPCWPNVIPNRLLPRCAKS
jgi:HPt (histidine-containing phosphotransfer) domain-containing protein